jgi:CheY-like chemotaxis protein
MAMAMAVGGGAEVEEGVTRVLVVDDSPVDRRVAQLLLSSGSCAGSFHGQPPPLSPQPLPWFLIPAIHSLAPTANSNHASSASEL